MLDIKIAQTTTPKQKPEGELGFGRIFTDHMFEMTYTKGQGWHDAVIKPFTNLSLSPATVIFHYGQEIFEGLKAYKDKNGQCYLFRPEMNAKRMNTSAKRLCMPEIPVNDFLQAVSTLVKIDQDWIPTTPGTSLYIRPFMIATEEFLGVAPSNEYKFMIILSPSGAYYKDGLNPVKIWIEDEYVRAVRGGTGFTKTGANYAIGLAGQEKAHADGYSQVLWLDGVEQKYVEEVGAMNIFFVINGKVVTPMLNGSILPGVTRDTVLTLCKYWGYDVEERKISAEELLVAQKSGILEEVFGTGTAAVISPVGTLRFQDEVMTIGDGTIGKLSQKLYDTVTGIQLGTCEDPFHWRTKI